jgi:Right handed beta helix region/Carboxypeptidase regulatory-like domain
MKHRLLYWVLVGRTVFIMLFFVSSPVCLVTAQVNRTTKSSITENAWPTVPPAQICGNDTILGGGPTSPPDGAITVPAGDNTDMHFVFRTPNATFWFAPGIHTLGDSEFGQIIPGSGTTFVGAPGAIIDGQRINRFAFTKLPDAPSTNVTIRYLTIRNFVSPLDQGVVNHDSQSGWTIEYNTVQYNEGGGVFLGSNNVMRYNCLADNGQYGFQVLGPFDGGDPTNIVIDHNEIARNNTGDWETRIPGCGCTGGAKFWLSNNTTTTNNWVHDNRSVGLWFDNNNRGALVEGNLIENNDAEGLFFEAGYDFLVRDNLLRRNALVKGRRFQSRGDPFPVAAIYVSESGAPPGYGLSHVPSVISNNSFQDNWGGVALWENADRYSGSTAHTHISGTIKIGDLHSDTQCRSEIPNDIPDNIDPYLCRWSTENVIVENNEFHIDKTAIGTGCAGGNFCGISGIFSNFGSYPEFSGFVIPWRITFQQSNVFRNNQYFGDWHFAGFETTRPDGSRVPWTDWIAPAPPIPPIFTSENRPVTFGQDAGSTYNNVPPPALVVVGGRVTTAQGRSVHRATVVLTDSGGNSRTTLTNSSGYFRFNDVATGQTYTVSATHKRYQFADSPRTVFVSAANENVNFIALP